MKWTVLHLEASPGWGGQEIRILREAQGIRQRGHTVVFVVMNGGRLAKEARKEGFVAYELNFHKQGWPAALLRLILILRRHRISLVNTHSSLDSWIGGIAARLCRIPIVRTRHLSTPNKPGINSRLLYGFLADRVVTTCSAIVPCISEKSGKPLSQVRSIPTGVDFSKIEGSEEESKAFRHSIEVSEEEFLVGTVCFMRSWKGLDDFMGAASLLRGEPRLKWVIVGGGHEETYRKKAKELRLEEVLRFTGHLPDPIPALKALDVFALLSTAHEGVSQAILQAAALRKPLIATETGGLCEVCLDGQTGIRVPAFSPERVAEAVLRMKNHEKERIAMGQRAHQLVLDRFLFQKTIDEMEEVYRQVTETVEVVAKLASQVKKR